jgi:murein DD-endopeptidase MepM/ murein hydrolase activator NlpD
MMASSIGNAVPRTVYALAASFLVGFAALAAAILPTTAEADGRRADRREPSLDHPFSDPVYYPLRKTIRLGCVAGNPGTKKPSGEPRCDFDPPKPDKHPFPAMDLQAGVQGDPVHAAGAGIFHKIEAPNSDCVPNAGDGRKGHMVWIDHGGGVVSRYFHLDSINPNLKEGQLVTPETVIGGLGHSGAVCDDRVLEYLHFEVRKGGLTGEYAEIGFGPKNGGVGSLYACKRGKTQEWPEALRRGAESWNDIEFGFPIPESDNSPTCFPVPATSDVPRVFDAKPGNASATLSWSAPLREDGVDHVTIEYQGFQPNEPTPTIRKWVDFPASTTSTKLRRLRNGWTYKFRLQFHNAAGYSKETPWEVIVPAAPPSPPRGMRFLTVERNTIDYGWMRSDAQGTPITGYEVAISRETRRGWTRWTLTRPPADWLHYKWKDLILGAKYRVKVRALSRLGPSSWLGPHEAQIP